MADGDTESQCVLDLVTSAAETVSGHNDGHMADGALVTHSIQYTILGQHQTDEETDEG